MKKLIKNPKTGEKRTRKRFAWEKTIVTDDKGNKYMIWLEFYMCTEEFVEYQKEVVEEWKTIENKIINKKL